MSNYYSIIKCGVLAVIVVIFGFNTVIQILNGNLITGGATLIAGVSFIFWLYSSSLKVPLALCGMLLSLLAVFVDTIPLAITEYEHVVKIQNLVVSNIGVHHKSTSIVSSEVGIQCIAGGYKTILKYFPHYFKAIYFNNLLSAMDTISSAGVRQPFINNSCFDAVLDNYDTYKDTFVHLPTETKEAIKAYDKAKIEANKSS
ncbi:hypothetical protein GCM10008107_16390 [Psychrosphaera saromensis]|uniref:Uncharacterized protein n=1 Tax=Psychrosphaera saromensis TaxID=716813 RepID=A0A2S7UTU0_9GAMM|nr:hypothetical protein [Psychrosphaera saromensis]PQJ53148.1 hypothetical protein BTO11_05370 [Psychrosphaera saromensis]GHB67665.1 hypothetical protein GCM10008107_16390 [Psychrosphaera saromensis]GLQ15095.1 hypothetical protein GCM10007917_25500 [Psychrosphaera saromensis]